MALLHFSRLNYSRLEDVDIKMIVEGLGATILLLLLIDRIRIVWFHPLSKFPGPVAAAISPYWVARCWNSGDYVTVVKQLHDRYGPIVRIASDQLSFCSPSSWRDIYGHVPGRKTFRKSHFFYEPMPGDAQNVLTVADTSVHSYMRRNLSHGFSAAALSVQEGQVQHFVDKFIEKIGENPKDPKEMVTWLNLVTFDIIGEMAFGESFGNLDAGKPHFWLKILFASIEALTFLRSFDYFAPVRALFRVVYANGLLPSNLTREMILIKKYSHDQVEKRLQANPEKMDFLSRIIANSKADGTSFDEIQSQAETLVLAGSETTATALAGIMYYLGRNPRVYAKLAQELRSSYQSYEDITGRSAEGLSYLKAVIDEGLRIYPPVPIGLPRVSPGETVDGHYIPEGIIVHVSSWSATHSDTNFHKPFEFIPERWLNDDCKDEKSASQPFLLGSRACLGRNLAYMELRLILSKLFFTFDFLLVDDSLDWVKANKTFVFWKKPDLWVKFTPRKAL